MSKQPSRPWILRVRRKVWRNGEPGWTRWRTFATYMTEQRATDGMQCLGSDDWRAYIRDRHTGRTVPPGVVERAAMTATTKDRAQSPAPQSAERE